MALTRILLGFGFMLVTLALAMLAPVGLAFASNDPDASGYLFGFIVTLTAGFRRDRGGGAK